VGLLIGHLVLSELLLSTVQPHTGLLLVLLDLAPLRNDLLELEVEPLLLLDELLLQEVLQWRHQRILRRQKLEVLLLATTAA